MSKTYLNIAELENENPALFEKISEAFNLFLPSISGHVAKSLAGQPKGTIAEHSTFVRLEDDDTKEKYFVEVRSLNIIIANRLTSMMHKLIFYDTYEEYEEARKAISNTHDSTHYGGKKLN